MNVHGDTLCVDGSQVGVFKKGDEVGFGSFLKGEDRRRLEAKVGLQGKKNTSKSATQVTHEQQGYTEEV